MPLITACPECHTQFVVKKEQLKAYEGQVRCGTCLHVFNAKTYLIKSARPKKITVTQVDAVLSDIDLEQDAPLDSAITVVDAGRAIEDDAAVEQTLIDSASDDSLMHDRPSDAMHIEEAHLAANTSVDTLAAPDYPSAQINDAENEANAFNGEINTADFAQDIDMADYGLATSADITDAIITETSVDAEPDSASVTEQVDSAALVASPASENSELNISTRQTISHADTNTIQDPFSQHLKKRPLSWPIVALCGLLLVVLLGQIAYFMRTEISAHFPQTKPWLSATCAKLGCSVALPKNIDYLTIDDSDMHEHLERTEVLVFTSTLINHAAYAQAYPIIELTLTNTNDEPVLRRTLTAKDYLTAQTDVAQGIPPNSDISIKLNLNTADIAVSGYRVSLSY